MTAERKAITLPLEWDDIAPAVIREQGGSRIISVTRFVPREWEVVLIASYQINDNVVILRVARVET